MIQQAIPTYGRGLVASLDRGYFERAVVICAPEAWAIVKHQFPVAPCAILDSFTMEQARLEEALDALPQAEAVFGIGGGSACDAAKFHAWRTGARLVLVPSILSVDAPYTSAVGVRVGHHVRYVGRAYPEFLLVDYDILQQAPARLNRAGIGDVLSIYTALYDWRLAASERGERYSPDLAAQSQDLFRQLAAGAEDVYRCNERGLRLISDLYVAEVAFCEEHGNSRPEEGSEHYIAYCLESLTHGHYIHGELIALTTLLTAEYQGQDSDYLFRIIRNSGVAYRPEEVGTSLEELKRALVALPEFLGRENQLPYGIFHHRPPTAADVADLLRRTARYFEGE